MSSHWRRHIYGALLFLVVIALGLTVGRQRAVRQESPSVLSVAAQSAQVTKETPSDDREANKPSNYPADYFVDQDRSEYQGYTVQRRKRKALIDTGGDTKNLWVDVNYVTVKSGTKTVRVFDADIYFGLGNAANFGFFPFLGGDVKQLFISQDVPRGGCQWVVSLSPRFKVLFDGRRFSVGREGSELGAEDLDNDGIYEIMATITDFYEFNDKMSMADIHLPGVIFKYDPSKGTYLPANSKFRDYSLEALMRVPGVEEEFHHRGAVLSNLLTYIYLGEAEQGWDTFDESYLLADKEEIRRRVKTILRRQPVYQLIYHCGKGNRTVACRF